VELVVALVELVVAPVELVGDAFSPNRDRSHF